MPAIGIRKRPERFVSVAALLAAMAYGGLAGPTEAASGTARGEAPARDQSRTVTAQNSEGNRAGEIGDGKNCGQSRKRLFVEGEGWIVRRVTTCY
jgi:hypothetical protein